MIDTRKCSLAWYQGDGTGARRRTRYTLLASWVMMLAGSGCQGVENDVVETTGLEFPSGPPRKFVFYNYVDSEATLAMLRDMGCKYIMRAGLIDIGRGSPQRAFMPSVSGTWEEDLAHMRDLVEKAHAFDMYFEGTILTFLIYEEEMTDVTMAMLDGNGEPIPWPSAPPESGVYFSNLNNPYFQEVLIEAGKKQIDAGVDAIHWDNPEAALVGLDTLILYSDPAWEERWAPFTRVVSELKAYARATRGRDVIMTANLHLLDQPPVVDLVTVGYTQPDPDADPAQEEWAPFEAWYAEHAPGAVKVFILDYGAVGPIPASMMDSVEEQVAYIRAAYETQFQAHGFHLALPVYYANDPAGPFYDAVQQGTLGPLTVYFSQLE